MNYPVTEDLKEWATPDQVRCIDAILENNGSMRKAARSLGLHHSTVQRAVIRARASATAHGYSPGHELTRKVPFPFIAKGHSTLDRVDPLTGERTQILQWTKTRLDDVAWIDEVKEGVAEFISNQTIDVQLPEGPSNFDTDVIPWIQIGDAHLGMLAHEAETGANFDLKIAETELCTAIATLLEDLPFVERLVIHDVGDFTHYENFSAKTEASGHDLDVDTRFPKMIKVYSRVMRFIIDAALQKAQNVDVIVNQGNHSRTNDIWMAELLRAVYGSSGRVNVLNNDTVFIGYRMGKTFVMTHHSDKCKPKDLAHVMATDFARDWGEAEFRYIDIGHIHHNMVLKEHPGVTVESWNQLAASDKYAHDYGYRSRSSISIVYRSRTYGEIGRRKLPIEQVRDIIRSHPGGEEHYVPQSRRAFTV